MATGSYPLTGNNTATLEGVGRSERVFPVDATSGQVLPIHYWRKGITMAAVILAAMIAIFLCERFVFGLKHQKHADDMSRSIAREPSSLAVRFFGLSHFTVAIYFLVTSKKLRTRRGMLLLGLFILMAAGVSYLISLAGGYGNKLIYIGVFIFFLIHAVRDEIFFYRQRAGQAISDAEYPHVYRMLMWVQIMGLALVAGFLYPIYIYGIFNVRGHVQFQEYLDMLMPGWFPLAFKMAAVSVPFFLLSALAYWKIQRHHEGGLVALLRSHWPVSVIIGTYLGVGLSMLALAGIAVPFLGAAVINVVVLLHFTGWFVFASAEISKQPREVQKAITWRTPNQWIRSNLTGFWVFHLGLAAFFFLLIALNHWVLAMRPISVGSLEIPNFLYLVTEQNTFLYWTVIHVILGFMPKPAPKRR